MEIKEEFYTSSFATFLHDRYDIDYEEVEKELERFGCDYEVIEHYLNKEYPKRNYFVLIDYNMDDDCFHIRIWEKPKKENKTNGNYLSFCAAFKLYLAETHPTLIESEIIVPSIDQIIDDYQDYIDTFSDITDKEDIKKHKELVSKWKTIKKEIKNDKSSK